MNTCMEPSPTHSLWLWPKHAPLAFSVAEMSGPKRPRPKCPTFYGSFLKKTDSIMIVCHDSDSILIVVSVIVTQIVILS